MTIKLRLSEQILLDAVAVDSNEANLNGVVIQPSTPYANSVYPIENYADAISGDGVPTKVLDGIRGVMAPLVRYVAPIYVQSINTSPSIGAFTGTTTLRAFTLSETLEVVRTAQISVQFSLNCDAGSTVSQYWIDINGTAYTALRGFHGTGSLNLSGSWIVTLPIGVPIVVSLKASRFSGTGSFSQGTSDFSNITLIS